MVQFQKTSNSSSKLLPNVGDFLLWYAKDIDEVKFNMVYEELSNIDEKVSFLSSYAMVEEEDGSARPLTPAERSNPSLLEDNDVKLFGRTSLFSQGWSFTGRSEPFTWNNRIWPVPVESHWAN